MSGVSEKIRIGNVDCAYEYALDARCRRRTPLFISCFKQRTRNEINVKLL